MRTVWRWSDYLQHYVSLVSIGRDVPYRMGIRSVLFPNIWDLVWISRKILDFPCSGSGGGLLLFLQIWHCWWKLSVLTFLPLAGMSINGIVEHRNLILQYARQFRYRPCCIRHRNNKPRLCDCESINQSDKKRRYRFLSCNMDQVGINISNSPRLGKFAWTFSLQ